MWTRPGAAAPHGRQGTLWPPTVTSTPLTCTTPAATHTPRPQARKLLRELPSLVDVDVPNSGHITVCGDVHGQVRSQAGPRARARATAGLAAPGAGAGGRAGARASGRTRRLAARGAPLVPRAPHLLPRCLSRPPPQSPQLQRRGPLRNFTHRSSPPYDSPPTHPALSTLTSSTSLSSTGCPPERTLTCSTVRPSRPVPPA
jgi:hypothetical protein